MSEFRDRELHLIGVGGAGMSALAVVAYAWGAQVSGCDRAASSYSERVERFGIPVAEGHDPAHLHPGMEVVISSAVPEDAPELEAARAMGLRIIRRGELLAEMVAARRSVCVGGAHGKTTTSGMIAYAAQQLGLDPTFLIGGEIPQLGGNAGPGGGDLLVAEADESDRSCALLRPQVAVVTNLDLDHHTSFESLDAVRRLFASWVAEVPAAGRVILGDDVDLPAHAPVERFGVSEGADWRVSGIESTPGGSAFWLSTVDGTPLQVSLAVPGAHNALNAAAAIAALHAMGADPADAAHILRDFEGAGRRYELRGTLAGSRIVDDYAHHPTEVAAVIAAARTQDPRRLLVCFQPHLYSRTQALAHDFGVALAGADEVVVTDIYPARERPVPGVSGKLVVDAVAEARPGMAVAYQPQLEGAAAYLRTRVHDGDIVLTVGAGDVRRVGDMLVEAGRVDPPGLDRREPPDRAADHRRHGRTCPLVCGGGYQ